MVARWSHIVDCDSGRQIKVSQGGSPANNGANAQA